MDDKLIFTQIHMFMYNFYCNYWGVIVADNVNVIVTINFLDMGFENGG